MDRPIVYPEEQGRSTDFLFGQRAAMVGISKLAEAMFGTSTVYYGLSVGANSPADLTVVVQPGQIYELEPLEASAYGILSADTSHQILKQGILLDASTLSCPAPTTSGYSINYLIQATYQDQDTNNVVLPYFNSTTPSQPLSGQNNSGAAQATERKGVCVVAVKAGAAATTGTQSTPSPDSGYVGLAVITVAYGQTTITSGNIATYGSAQVLNGGIFNVTAPDDDNSTRLATTAGANKKGAVVGTSRNLKMSVATASATATLTADEIVVESALGGAPIRLANINQTINLATTGAGGMDTGSAPVSGYVAIYEIYNPTTDTKALLGFNATSAVAPEVYGGANMPAGYTASALVSVWPTNASGQLVFGYQANRLIEIYPTTAYSGSTIYAAGSTLSIAGVVPKNAKSISGSLIVSSSVSSTLNLLVSGGATRVGEQGITATSTSSIGCAYSGISLVSPQTIGILASSTAGTPSFQVFVSSYTF